jgi:hypothetical protein
LRLVVFLFVVLRFVVLRFVDLALALAILPNLLSLALCFAERFFLTMNNDYDSAI